MFLWRADRWSLKLSISEDRNRDSSLNGSERNMNLLQLVLCLLVFNWSHPWVPLCLPPDAQTQNTRHHRHQTWLSPRIQQTLNTLHRNKADLTGQQGTLLPEQAGHESQGIRAHNSWYITAKTQVEEPTCFPVLKSGKIGVVICNFG